MLDELTGALRGVASPDLSDIIARLQQHLEGDPDLSFQLAAYRDGERILDVWGGPHLEHDSLIVPYSVSKNTIGLVVGLLIQRGQLDLDTPVAEYWPEFAAKGKHAVTVRQLLSHQAGLPQATPVLSWAELLDHHAAAERLAASRPFWHPGSSFGYHAISIGNLASELVFRITGSTLNEVFDREIREPFDLDVFLGLPAAEESRRVPVLPIVKPVIAPEGAAGTALGPRIMAMSGEPVDLGNDPVSWRFGHPAASSTVTADGLARMFAATVTGLEGAAPLLDADTVEVIGQQQVRGFDEVLGLPDRAHSIVFQKPSSGLPFGGPRAFGHDGAAGAFACVDPDAGLALGYTVARGPWPGGADPRAIAVAVDLNARYTR
ncbi:beta-lactamase family protein [Plantibacter flavus]|uniref:serine hydrolase domain-containing protein n=1 Tax=Plantibacter flavus TaxID=150123 RepID=UPI003F138401